MKQDTGKLVPTGVEGLDEILLGGVIRNNNILVEGPPGSGKTTLGLGFIHAGARSLGEPGLIVSFELSAEKLLRDASSFNWDFQGLQREKKIRIVETTPNVLLRDLRLADSMLFAEIQALKARRLLIDGLTPLRIHASEEGDFPFRERLNVLVEALTSMGVTTLVTREIDAASELHAAPERFVFDTILALGGTERRRCRHRSIEITKSRGQNFIGGRHTLRIEEGFGLHVYRRTQSRPIVPPMQPTSNRRLGAGSPALDELLGGGVFEGSTTLITGISGTGKTVCGLQFLLAGLEEKQRGLFITLDEHPQQLLRNARSVGLDLQPAIDAGDLFILYDSPLELELDVHFDRIAQLVEKHGIERLVFDSMAAYETSGDEEATDFMYALASFCKDRLATAFFNYETPELLGISQISEQLKGSHLVDNIVLLNYVEISTKIRRAITVPKVRGSKNPRQTREYEIQDNGIVLLSEELGDAGQVPAAPQLPFSSYYGLLARSPARRSPIIDEALAAGEPLPSSPKLEKEDP